MYVKMVAAPFFGGHFEKRTIKKFLKRNEYRYSRFDMQEIVGNDSLFILMAHLAPEISHLMYFKMVSAAIFWQPISKSQNKKFPKRNEYHSSRFSV